MTSPDAPIVRFEHVDVVFGPTPAVALGLLDQGKTRADILKETANTVAVHGADLAIPEGELCVLMGLSGSGKSSLLRCVNGLNKISRGRMLVADGGAEVDVGACDAATLRRLRMNRISMVFQQFALMPWRTIRDNVALGLELRGVARTERNRIVEEKLALVRLDAWADKFPRELSGGMQQRVGLARAFATDAEILLMDEPFSALDPLIRGHLQDELLDLQRKLQKTIVFVSHDLDEALKIGNRIVIMESGRIVQVGRPEEIVTTPADDYVAAFVAHVNPLNVLRGETLMRPAAALARQGGRLSIDARAGLECTLDAAGCPAAVLERGQPIRLRRDDGKGEADFAADECACGPVGLPMRRAIELRHATHRPVLLLDGEGRLAGIIGEDEITRGILRRHQ